MQCKGIPTHFYSTSILRTCILNVHRVFPMKCNLVMKHVENFQLVWYTGWVIWVLGDLANQPKPLPFVCLLSTPWKRSWNLKISAFWKGTPSTQTYISGVAGICFSPPFGRCFIFFPTTEREQIQAPLLRYLKATKTAPAWSIASLNHWFPLRPALFNPGFWTGGLVRWWCRLSSWPFASGTTLVGFTLDHAESSTCWPLDGVWCFCRWSNLFFLGLWGL